MIRLLGLLIILSGTTTLGAQIRPTDSLLSAWIESYRGNTFDVQLGDSLLGLIEPRLSDAALPDRIAYLEARAYVDLDWDRNELGIARLDSAYALYPPEALPAERAYNRAERGRALAYLGDCQPSIELFKEALGHISDEDAASGRIRSYYLMALVYCEEYDIAIEAGLRQISLLSDHPKIDYRIIAAIVVGNSYNNLNQPERAIPVVQDALAVIPEPKIEYQYYSNLLTEMGNAYMMQGDHEAAYQTFKASQRASEIEHPDYEDNRSTLNIARTAYQTGRFAESKRLFARALPRVDSIGDVSIIAEAMGLGADAYYAVGLVDSAFLLSRYAYELRDTIYNLEMRKATREFTTQFETERIRTDLELAEVRVAQQRDRNRYLTLASIGGLLLAGMSFLLYHNRQRRRRLTDAKRRVELEYNLLRAQMNPHFIFNSLNSIQGYFSTNRFDRGNAFLGKFAKLMRRVLDLSAHQRIPLSDELETLELYLELEALRLKNRLHYRIDVDSEVETDLVTVPPLLLQPFVENAIWHGIAPKNGAGNIDIRVENGAHDQLLHVSILDDGVGLRNDIRPNHDSKGIRITRERLGAGGAVSIANRSEENTTGVSVNLTIPVT